MNKFSEDAPLIDETEPVDAPDSVPAPVHVETTLLSGSVEAEPRTVVTSLKMSAATKTFMVLLRGMTLDTTISESLQQVIMERSVESSTQVGLYVKTRDYPTIYRVSMFMAYLRQFGSISPGAFAMYIETLWAHIAITSSAQSLQKAPQASWKEATARLS